jgi:uncharacterized protein YcaQ
MIKSAAIIKDKTLAPWKELRLQKRRFKKQQTIERKANKVYFPSRIDATIIEVQNAPQDDAPLTRDELQAKATDLGIPFNGRTTDKKLSGLISTALAQGA